MIRLFLKSYLIIALPLLILFLPPRFNPVIWLFETLASPHYSNQMRAVFYLVERQLSDLPQEQWPQRILETNDHFGLPLEIHAINDLDLPKAQEEKLLKGKIITKLGGNARLYKHIANSGFYLLLYLDSTNEADNQLFFQGPIHLLNEELKALPQTQWKAFLAEGSVHSGIPIEMSLNDSLPTAVQENTLWQRGKTLDHPLSNLPDHAFYYIKSFHPEWTYKIGPVDERTFLSTISLLNQAIPASLLAIGILILAWPLWIAIGRLQKATRRFGKGDLDTRVKVWKHSSLRPVAHGFNAMAEHIQKLIQHQKELTRAVSHELRTPLARLRFEIEMLQTEKNAHKKKALLEGVNDDIDELESLVNELLLHSRYEQHSLKLSKNTDITAWLKQYLRHYRSPVPGISVTTPHWRTLLYAPSHLILMH